MTFTSCRLPVTHIAAIQNRGYAQELSGSAEISNFISRMYPHFTSAFLSNGLPIAVPFSMYAKCYGYNLAAFEKLGLTEQDVPKTWTELCDFAANWKQKYAQDHPDMSLFGLSGAQDDLASTLFNDMITDYISYMTYSGTELSFDTPMFRELIAPFAGAKWTDSVSICSADSIKAARMSGRDNDSQLFSLWGSALIKSSSETTNTRLMPLMLQDGVKSVFTADTYVLVINPYSKNMDAAIRYLEYQAKYLDEATLADLMPDRNDPIRDPYYDSNLRQMQDDLSSAQAALEGALRKTSRRISRSWTAAPNRLSSAVAQNGLPLQKRLPNTANAQIASCSNLPEDLEERMRMPLGSLKRAISKARCPRSSLFPSSTRKSACS